MLVGQIGGRDGWGYSTTSGAGKEGLNCAAVQLTRPETIDDDQDRGIKIKNNLYSKTMDLDRMKGINGRK